MRLPVLPDTRAPEERSAAIDRARDQPEARALLAKVVAALDDALASTRPHGGVPWNQLDRAYRALDAYLAHLTTAAELDVRCAAGCSACCTDAPPTFPVEGLRLVRALHRRTDGIARIRRAIDQAQRFQSLLHQQAATPQVPIDTAATHYRRTQLEWRALGHPCVALENDGRCGAYADRPLACRVHVHIEDPAHCAPSHPGFLVAERPPVWAHPSEAEVEQRLLTLGRMLGLPGTPNLPWAVAALHDHPATR